MTPPAVPARVRPRPRRRPGRGDDPAAGPPVGRRRGRSRWWAFGALLLVGVVIATVVVGPGRLFCGGVPLELGSQIYTEQPARSAEWAATRQGSYSDAQIDQIAQNTSYFFIPKFAENFDISKQFDDVRRLKAAAKKYDNDLKVFMYINAQYWLNANDTTWKPYAADFKKSWYLDGADGQPVPFYGQTGTADAGTDPIGYLIDLSNPALRQFIVKVGVDWLKQAPLDGVVFDSANPMLGQQTVRRANGDGTSTANQLLCGASTRVDANGNCPRVAAWNTGLSDVLQSMTDAFTPKGAEVAYNGIAPSPLRENRNVANLAHADGASNEGFCYQQSFSNKTNLSFNSVTDDAQLMQQAAAQGKKLFEITNYQSPERNRYGSYCLGSFLMGWQPGSSFFVYHEGYGSVESKLPILPDQDLALGEPSSVGFQQQGDVLSRSFAHGFVAVNVGDKPAVFTATRSGSQFADGELVGRIGDGGTVTLPARSSAFFLDVASVPAVGSAFGAC